MPSYPHSSDANTRLRNIERSIRSIQEHRNSTTMISIGDWNLMADLNGNLIATNAATGYSTVLATPTGIESPVRVNEGT